MNPQTNGTDNIVNNESENLFDVVILGGGFAGATLALHLALHLPEVSVAIIEPKSEPPRFAHKVGESSLGPQGTYLAEWLQLKAYLFESHVEKFGTRYFFGDTVGPFIERPEIGARHAVTEFPIYEFQVDRGKFEADLQEMVKEKGVTWLPYKATDVQFGDGETAHTVALLNPKNKQSKTLRARWVIDATGRRRFLHRQHHGRNRAPNGRCSAAWFRVPGWVDVDDFVSSTETDWHARVAPQHPRDIPFGRFNSTNHLCGEGYWVWLIPLPDGVMSIGIVTDEELVPFELYNTEERARNWLASHEPLIATAIENHQSLDFRTMRRYSYPVDDFISTDRWALIGDALGFSDPFYSPGGDMIGLANLIVVETIRRERQGILDPKGYDQLTQNMARIQAIITDAVQSIYPCLGESRVAGAHIIWDFFSVVTPLSLTIRNFNSQLYDYLSSLEAQQMLTELAVLQQDMAQLMIDWVKEDQPQMAMGSMIDHTEKLGKLSGHLWGQTFSKDVPTLINFLFDYVKTVANDYHTHGLNWAFFDESEINLPAKQG